jgi:DNA-directed RNA polymerase specialized sigma54-like protein
MTRQSLTQAQRRDRFEETNDVATEIIKSQRKAREEKTARLRALRLKMEADEAATHAATVVKHSNKH